MEGKDLLIAGIILFGVFLAGYLISPEYINLDDVERTGYEVQIDTLTANHKNEIDGWLQFANDCNAYADTIHAEERAQCVLDIAETADRMSEKNMELIIINDDWQDLFEDMNESVHDLNNTIADLNCWR